MFIPLTGSTTRGDASSSLRSVWVSRSSEWNTSTISGVMVPVAIASSSPMWPSTDRTARSLGGTFARARPIPGTAVARITAGTLCDGAPTVHPSWSTRETRSGCAAAARNVK